MMKMKDKYTSVKECLDCGSKTIVVDSRVKPYGAVWRKRKCTKCGYTFNTLEMEECMTEAIDLLDEIEKLNAEIRFLKLRMADAKKLL